MTERTALVGHVEDMLLHSCVEHLPDDVVELGASLYPLPSDGGWAPSVFIYVMAQPIGEADGCHLGQFVSPYQLTQELVDTYVKEFADTFADSLRRLRELRKAGAVPALGLAEDDLVV